MKRLAWFVLVAVLVLSAVRPALADTLYVVQPGDTLYRIAARFGVTVSAIVSANALPNPNLIYAGQLLTIPGPGSEPPATPGLQRYVVQPGDTLWRIAQRFGTTVPALMSANGLTTSRIYAGQVLLVPAPAPPGTPAPTRTPPPAATQPPTPIPTPCGLSWFFANAPAGTCPAAPPLVTLAAAERFERGLMIWLSQTNTFLVFLNRPHPDQAARLVKVVGPLTITPGGSVDNRVGGAPTGLTEPVSGFGLLWRGEATQYPPGLRAELGWAVEAEYAYEATLQCAAYPGTSYPSPNCYLRGPRGEIYYYYYLRYFGDFWENL